MVRLILLDFSLKTQHCLLHFSLFDKLSCLLNKINSVLCLLLSHVWVLLLECKNGWIFGHFYLVVVCPHVPPRLHHFIHFLKLACLLHPFAHHVLHLIISELLFALKDVSELVCIGFNLLLFFLALHFFYNVPGDLFFLPLISHLSVNIAKLCLLLSILDKRISFHRISPMVELKEELEEFTVPMLRVLGLR